MNLNHLAIVFMSIGSLVTILFWIPKLVNRPQLKELLGTKYPVIYLFYFSNGPFLLFIGLYLLWYQHP